MNPPVSTHTHQPATARSAGAFDPAHRPEHAATVAAVYVNGAGQDPSSPVVAWASELSFDVRINSAGGGPSSLALGVGFSNPVPSDDEYKVVVNVGDEVIVQSTGKFDRFIIPWKPNAKPCPAQPGSAARDAFRRKVKPTGIVAEPPDTGGGDGPTGFGGAGPSSGASGDGGVPP